MLARPYLFRITLLLVAVLVGLLPDAQGTTAAADRASVSGDAFGPQFFLLSPAPDRVGELAGLPGDIHAALYTDGPEHYLASGPATLPVAAAAIGISAELLDTDTAGKAYYFADAQAPDAAAQAGRFGRILYEDAWQLVLAVPRENEADLLETLPLSGISLALIPTAALPLDGRLSATVTAAAPLPTANDPRVEAMLSQVSPATLSQFIGELSGESPATVDGAQVTLATRYTFSPSIRNAEKYLSQRYVELGLPVTYANWTYGSYSGRNVVAELRGTVYPERIWLVGGHFDSISETPYSYAPGADDNATGTAATLALAGILKQHRFRDTVRFVHFSGEEQGHWGSIVYARNLSTAGTQVQGYVNLDMIGYDSDNDRTMEIHSGTRTNSIDLAGRFVSANQRYNQGLRVELKQSSASRFSDHASFWDYGYASFLAIENFFDDDIPRDRNPWYHTTGDRLSRVNLDYVARTARTTLALLAEAAGLESSPEPIATWTATPTPTWTPTPSACPELVINGGFESNTGWTFAATATQARYSTAYARTGARSAQLGIVPAGNATGTAEEAGLTTGESATNLLGENAPLGASYSTAYQTITVPAGAPAATLTFWVRPGTEGVAGNGDYQRVLLLRPGSYRFLATVTKMLANTTTWQQVSFDLTPYRGQQVVLYFEVLNDNTNAAPRTWLYVDDVSARPCAPTPLPTATHTAGAATATPTRTATHAPPTVMPTRLTATATATLSLSPTSTLAAPTATSTNTPSPTATPAPSQQCTEHVINGDFESATGWTFARTANPGGYTTAIARSGARAGRLGVVVGGGLAASETGELAPDATANTNLLGESAPAGASYSTAYQTIALPADADTLTLRFWHRPGTQATTGNGDFQRVLLLKPRSYAVVKTLTKMLANSSTWHEAKFDLAPYRGQSLVLYFEVYNDNINAGPRTWMYVDDVEVTTCVRLTGAGEPEVARPVYLPLVIVASP